MGRVVRARVRSQGEGGGEMGAVHSRARRVMVGSEVSLLVCRLLVQKGSFLIGVELSDFFFLFSFFSQYDIALAHNTPARGSRMLCYACYPLPRPLSLPVACCAPPTCF
jgi:hypothetical protein